MAETGSSGQVHYWTGRGTLCSLDNGVRQPANATSDRTAVTCAYCRDQIARNAKPRTPEAP